MFTNAVQRCALTIFGMLFLYWIVRDWREAQNLFVAVLSLSIAFSLIVWGLLPTKRTKNLPHWEVYPNRAVYVDVGGHVYVFKSGEFCLETFGEGPDRIVSKTSETLLISEGFEDDPKLRQVLRRLACGTAIAREDCYYPQDFC